MFRDEESDEVVISDKMPGSKISSWNSKDGIKMLEESKNVPVDESAKSFKKEKKEHWCEWSNQSFIFNWRKNKKLGNL